MLTLEFTSVITEFEQNGVCTAPREMIPDPEMITNP